MEKTYNMIKNKLDGNICDLLKKPNMSLMGNRSMGTSYERGYTDGMNDASGKRYYVDTNMSMANQRSGHSIDDRIIACMEKMYDEAGSEYERKRIDDVIAHIHNTGM